MVSITDNTRAVLSNGLWGIEVNGREAIPCVYEKKEDAYEEFKYFIELNNSLPEHKKFLQKDMTTERHPNNTNER